MLRKVPSLLALGLAAGVVLAAAAFPVVGGLGVAVDGFTARLAGASTSLATGVVPRVTTVLDATSHPIAYLYDQYRPASAAAVARRWTGDRRDDPAARGRRHRLRRHADPAADLRRRPAAQLRHGRRLRRQGARRTWYAAMTAILGRGS